MQVEVVALAGPVQPDGLVSGPLASQGVMDQGSRHGSGGGQHKAVCGKDPFTSVVQDADGERPGSGLEDGAGRNLEQDLSSPARTELPSFLGVLFGRCVEPYLGLAIRIRELEPHQVRPTGKVGKGGLFLGGVGEVKADEDRLTGQVLRAEIDAEYRLGPGRPGFRGFIAGRLLSPHRDCAQDQDRDQKQRGGGAGHGGGSSSVRRASTAHPILLVTQVSASSWVETWPFNWISRTESSHWPTWGPGETPRATRSLP